MMTFVRHVLAAGLFLLGTASAVRADDATMTPHADNAVIPVYQDNRLQFIVHSRKLVRHGNLSNATDPIIDILRRDAKLTKLASLVGTKPYPRGAALPVLLRFWSKHPLSDGLVFSPAAEIDQTNRGAMGEDAIHFRSPLLDLDGIGYTVDYKTRTIKVNKKVQIVIRSGYREPADLVRRGLKNPAAERIDATSDRMKIEFARNLITLSGNVKVHEARFDLAADEILIHFGDRSSRSTGALGGNAGGLSKIVCNGDVRIDRRLSAAEQRGKGPQFATGEQGIYHVKQDIFELHRRAVLYHGRDKISADHMKLFRKMEQAELWSNCRFELSGNKPANVKKPTVILSKTADVDYSANIANLAGNVHITDTAGELDCAKMRLHFRDVITDYDPRDPVEKTPSRADPDEKTAIPELKGSGSGSKRLRRIDCSGDVHAIDDRAELLSDDMVIHLADPDSTPRHTGEARADSRSGIERIVCTGNVRLENRPIPAQRDTRKFVLTSDSGEMRMFDNTAVFRNRVKVRDARMHMTCDQAYLYARDLKPGTAPGNERDEDDPVPERIAVGDSRELKYIVAHNKVHVTRYNDKAELQEAFGTRGVYEVAKRTVVLTGTPEKPPILRQGGSDMLSDAVLMHLDSEEIEVKNGRANIDRNDDF